MDYRASGGQSDQRKGVPMAAIIARRDAAADHSAHLSARHVLTYRSLSRYGGDPHGVSRGTMRHQVRARGIEPAKRPSPRGSPLSRSDVLGVSVPFTLDLRHAPHSPSAHRGVGHVRAQQPAVSPKTSQNSSPTESNGDANARQRTPLRSRLSSMPWWPTCCSSS
jgi:hypothetical protein